MPAVGFGTYLIAKDAAAACTQAAIAAGYRHIDTAEGYSNEAEVGAGIKASGIAREELFVTTKLWPGNPAWGMPIKTSDETIACCEASLKKLGLDYVDLYLIHAPFAFSASAAAGLAQWEALLALKARGLCRSVGVSNFGVKHLEAIEKAGLALPDANQLEIHPVCQQEAVLAWMAPRKILPIAYSSLAPLATWRVQPDSTAQSSGKHRAEAGKQEAVAGALAAAAAAHGARSEASVLLRWALQKGYPVLPKSVRPERIASNFALFGEGMELTAAEMGALDGLNEGGDVCLAWAHGDPCEG